VKPIWSQATSALRAETWLASTRPSGYLRPPFNAAARSPRTGRTKTSVAHVGKVKLPGHRPGHPVSFSRNEWGLVMGPFSLLSIRLHRKTDRSRCRSPLFDCPLSPTWASLSVGSARWPCTCGTLDVDVAEARQFVSGLTGTSLCTGLQDGALYWSTRWCPVLTAAV
jgi:hypothetical protein